jgi:hypothetical protein
MEAPWWAVSRGVQSQTTGPGAIAPTPRTDDRMATEDRGSISRGIGELKAAADPLCARDFDQLVRFAGAGLRASRRIGVVADEEDAALGAFQMQNQRTCCARDALGWPGQSACHPT